MTDLYLASRSSRRRDLLKQIGVRFEPLLLRLSTPRGPDIDETPQPGEDARTFVSRVASSPREGAAMLIVPAARRALLRVSRT